MNVIDLYPDISDLCLHKSILIILWSIIITNIIQFFNLLVKTSKDDTYTVYYF